MDRRTECIFGEKCYRKNPHHFREYRHKHLYEKYRLNHHDLLLPSDEIVDRDQFKIYSTIEKEFTSNNKDAVKKVEENKKNTSSSDTPSSSSSSSSSDNQASSSSSNSRKRSRSPSSSDSDNHQNKKTKTKQSRILQKLEAAKPFNFFLTMIKDNPSTHKSLNSVFFMELLHPSLGSLSSSLQINFMVDLEFLMMNYEETKNDSVPLVILYGAENPELSSSHLSEVYPSVRAVRVKPKYPYGTHHTKMMLLVYEDGGLRVVVHTANLIPSDWENRSQGVWVSDKCPPGQGDSKTGFKASLLRYLRYYEVSAVHQFISAVEKVDMSSINTVFTASVPGSHKDGAMCHWGHRHVARTLRSHVPRHVSSWPVIAQCSSIGSLGPTPDTWFEREFASSLASVKSSGPVSVSRANISLIYPTHQDVVSSHDGLQGGGCLPYSRATASKQPWLQDHLCRWRAEASDRTRAMPHIKTYTRLSPDNSNNIPFFILTSANMSKAAWGSVNQAGNSCLIMSYEAGVIWLPSMVTGHEMFETVEFRERRPGSELFPLHYDLPLSRYQDNDKPWLIDALR